MARRANRHKDTEAIWSAGFTHRPYSPVIRDSGHAAGGSRRIDPERRTTDVDRVIHSLLRRRRGRIFCGDLHVEVAHGSGRPGDQASTSQAQARRQSRTRGGRPAPGIRRHTPEAVKENPFAAASYVVWMVPPGGAADVIISGRTFIGLDPPPQALRRQRTPAETASNRERFMVTPPGAS